VKCSRKEQRLQQKYGEVAALINFGVFPCSGHQVSSSSARLKTAVLFAGLCKGLHPPARSQQMIYLTPGYKTTRQVYMGQGRLTVAVSHCTCVWPL